MIRGQLDTGGEPGEFAGHRVTAWPIGGQGKSDATVDDMGRFQLMVPAPAASQSWTFEVRGPSGRLLNRTEVLPTNEPVRIVVAPERGLTAPQPPVAPRRPTTSTITVVGADGAPLQRGTSVALVVKLADGQERTTATAKIDSHGRVILDAGAEPIKQAWLVAGGALGRRVELPLTADRLHDRAVAMLPDGGRAPRKEDCGCDDAPLEWVGPDVIEDPARARLVKGAGCVRFDEPNRALDQFSFRTVVRTSEPSIRGVNLPTEPPTIASQPNVATIAGEATPIRRRLDFGRASDRTTREEAWGMAATGAETTLDAVRNRVELKLASLDLDALAEPSTNRDRANSRAELGPANQLDWNSSPTFYEATGIAHGHVLTFRTTWSSDGYSLGDLLYSLPLAPAQKKQVVIVDWSRQDRASLSERTQERDALSATLTHDRDVGEIAQAFAEEHVKGRSRSASASLGFAGGVPLFGISGGAAISVSSAAQDGMRQISAYALQSSRERIQQSASSIRDQRITVVRQASQAETSRVTSEVVANHNHCHAMTVQYFEVLRHLSVSQEIVDVSECLFVPLPMRMFDRPMALQWREQLTRALRDRSLERAFDATERQVRDWDGDPGGRRADQAVEWIEGTLQLRFRFLRPRDDNEGNFNEVAWSRMERTWASSGRSPRELFDQYLAGLDARSAKRDEAFHQSIAPLIADFVVKEMAFFIVTQDGDELPVPCDFTLLDRYSTEQPCRVSVRIALDAPGIRRAEIDRIYLRAVGAGDRMTYELTPDSTVMVEEAQLSYRTDQFEHSLVRRRRVNDDLDGRRNDPVVLPVDFLSAFERRDGQKEDREISARLIGHLNQHIEYYHRAIWMQMDSARRYMLLDGVLAPNANGRSVASVVENRLIGIVGNSLVLPVAPGLRLDPTLREATKAVSLLDLYRPVVTPPPLTVSLPTGGVFAESVMGNCNSCEPIDETRFWGEVDEPTAIQSPSADSRYQAPLTTTPTPLGQPIIAMQQAPSLPDPSGIGAILNAVTKPDLFRDLTGLAGTQAAAGNALQSAFSTAQTLALEAARLQAARDGQAGADRQLKRIAETPNLTDEQRQQLTYDTLARASGIPAPGRDAPKPLSEQPGVRQLLETARGAGKGSVSIVDGAAKVETEWTGGEMIEMARVAGEGGGVEPSAEVDKLLAIKSVLLIEHAILNWHGGWYSLREEVGDDQLQRLATGLVDIYDSEQYRPGKWANEMGAVTNMTPPNLFDPAFFPTHQREMTAFVLRGRDTISYGGVSRRQAVEVLRNIEGGVRYKRLAGMLEYTERFVGAVVTRNNRGIDAATLQFKSLPFSDFKDGAIDALFDAIAVVKAQLRFIDTAGYMGRSDLEIISRKLDVLESLKDAEPRPIDRIIDALQQFVDELLKKLTTPIENAGYVVESINDFIRALPFFPVDKPVNAINQAAGEGSLMFLPLALRLQAGNALLDATATLQDEEAAILTLLESTRSKAEFFQLYSAMTHQRLQKNIDWAENDRMYELVDTVLRGPWPRR